jgi:hypothetical protein
MRGFPNGFRVCRLFRDTQSQKCARMTTPANKKKRKKKTALVVCRDRKEFWTTQTQFWQWVREGIVMKVGDQPLTGLFRREHEELMVLLSNTVLNLAHPNHMREALLSRRIGIAGK